MGGGGSNNKKDIKDILRFSRRMIFFVLFCSLLFKDILSTKSGKNNKKEQKNKKNKKRQKS